MEKLRLNTNGILVPDKRLQAFTVSAVNQHPPKRLQRLQQLLKTKSPRICVIRGEGIGDVLMTTPTINGLVQLFNSKVHITYATNTQYLNGALIKVLKYNSQIDQIIDRDSLKEEDFDIVINLHCPAILHERPMAPPVNRIDLFANHAGVTLQDKLPKYFINHEEIIEANMMLQNMHIANKSKILVNTISSSSNRSLINSNLINALIELSKQGYQLLIVSHDNSDYTSTQNLTTLPGAIPLKNKDVRELAAIMTHCDLTICPDSALLHVAGALSLPAVSIFGPTDPRARTNYYPTVTALWGGKNLAGHPHWYEKCPYGDLCWKNTTSEEIYNACISKINSKFKNQLVFSEII